MDFSSIEKIEDYDLGLPANKSRVLLDEAQEAT